jgi:hypothetical protein
MCASSRRPATATQGLFKTVQSQKAASLNLDAVLQQVQAHK